MRRIKYKKVRKVQPNNFEYTGNYKTAPVAMQLFVYKEEAFKEYTDVLPEKAIKECNDDTKFDDVKWFNIHGLHDVELIKQIGRQLNLENFVIDDILNTSRRTRIEELEDVLFFSVKSILPKEDEDIIDTEQISFVLKDNLIISFQEKKSDYFSHIRERIRTSTGVIRKKKTDYLLYLMLDAIIENFFITIEKYEGSIEQLTLEAKTNYKADIITKVERMREDLNYLKRAISPLKEALYNLRNAEEDGEFEVINVNSYTFFTRLHHKSLELLDQVEYDLNSLESISNFHYSAQGQRMNEIMKTLTIYSAIFMPITFIVGVYGMNFENMPELHAENGYYIILGLMIVITVVMIIYFKVKDWF
ncbi:magnesium and cobalt transport protein CorA [Flavobacterium arcticum]|uniref:Magnesium transport protein CorA n=1 Tax=Flavobacterium arcticum TaxID=1784713 RepID=A0A345HFB3_9FLAO|nr:magnesium/cobalt transporter CorA [Flavobacterium arcticum]AXG75273.1 magnesium and cobalt transport protein CorA [Flavobacterium arcticum]KAF2512411.1 magnesium/cobalt transporter CorA [Flavobacterium arcticum]